MSPLNILIVGGGIAGCCAAISLAQKGHRIRMVEKQEIWKFQSSGIFVYSNGLESLENLGLLDEILSAGFVIPGGRNIYFDHSGSPIVETIYPEAKAGRIPAILGIKRAELHRVMTSRVAAMGVPVALGTTVTALQDIGNSVKAVLSDGSTSNFDLIVGADGIRSAIRDMIGVNLQPRYCGLGVWRSVHRRPVDLKDKIMMMGPAKRFGIMPISDDLLYTFGTVAEPENQFYSEDSWPDEMHSKFKEFSDPAKPFLQELGTESHVHFTAIEEVVLPLPWYRGRVLLIGDAAHASTPFMGQGGAMAMQDAVILSEVLESPDPLGARLTRFGEMRAPLCKFVQDASRAVGDAGAKEDIQNLQVRNEELKKTAQNNVDQFYETLNNLNAKAKTLLS